MEVSSEGGASSGTIECSQRRSGFGKMLRLFSLARNGSAGTSSLSLVQDALMRWNTCRDLEEDQNLTTTDAPSASSLLASEGEEQSNSIF